MGLNKGGEWAFPLEWLAELDNCEVPDALANAFGDRYLCRHNPVFAAVRRSAIEFDYRFSAEDTPLWRDYQAFGLTTLHKILSGRIIPYHDTGNTVRRLLEDNPKLAMPTSFLLGNLKPNYVFHESAHCVACSVLHGMESDLRAVAPEARERFVLEAILAESFANTIETLGSLVQTRPLSDALFYSLNSYMAPKPKKTLLLEEAGAETGEYLRFTLLLLSFFEANLAITRPDEATRERVSDAANCNAGMARAAGAITDAAFRLNAQFRKDTTPAYFEILGFQREYMALTQAEWLSRSDHRQFIGDLISKLFDSLQGNCPGRGMFAR